MTDHNGILIKNYFYMLSYAYSVLRQSNYEDIESEEFEHTEDLFAAILSRGMAQQVKQGLFKEYISEEEDLQTVRGRIKFNHSITLRIQKKKMLHCEYDELSENNIMNQILKSTAIALSKNKNVCEKNQQALKGVLMGFQYVDTINLNGIQWGRIGFQRNNQNYRMLLFICYFVINSLLMSTESGDYKMRMFSEDQWSHIYEKFILEYYSAHHPELSAKAEMVEWKLSGEETAEALAFLPRMKTDITLRRRDNDKTLIIDAKFYKNMFQSNYGKESIRNSHLNQVIVYVLNDDPNGSKGTKGLLLYALPDGKEEIDANYTMAGKEISVQTLDLNRDFEEIKKKLDRIPELYLM